MIFLLDTYRDVHHADASTKRRIVAARCGYVYIPEVQQAEDEGVAHGCPAKTGW
jgi:hypothetical protein